MLIKYIMGTCEESPGFDKQTNDDHWKKNYGTTQDPVW